MDLISLLAAALGTAAGKAAVVATVTAATAGGLAATDVVELPDLSDKPAEVTTDDQRETPELPAEATLRGGNVGEQADVEAKKAAAAERKAAGQAHGQDDVEAGESQGIGEAVSGAASEGEGPARDRVLPLTPANDRAQDAGAPETAGERQDATEARQDTETDAAADARRDADAPHDADAAEEHTPEQVDDAGSQAEGRRGGAAADARP